MVVHVEIWSDVVCPWCYVGKRRFEAALGRFEHRDEVEVTWRSFELDPSAPRERDVDGATHLARKYGMERERALTLQRGLAELAAADGLDLRFDLARGGNSFDAHRLIQLGRELGVQSGVKERLMYAYFTEGELIGDPEALARIAREAGLPEDEVRELLVTERYAEEVREDERDAAALGINAVPCFVVDRRMGVSGAQEPELLLKLLTRAWAQA